MILPELPALTTGQLVLVVSLLALAILPNYIAIWQSFHREFPTPLEKALWSLLAIFVPVLGGLAYLIWGRKRGRKPS